MSDPSLSEKIKRLVNQLESFEPVEAAIDTRNCLHQWASQPDITHVSKNIELLLKRFDIDNAWYLAYNTSGSKKSKTQLNSTQWLELACLLLMHTVMFDQSLSKQVALKRFNVLYKIKKQCSQSEIWDDQPLADRLKSCYQTWLNTTIDISGLTQLTPWRKEESVKTIPLTVLFYEGPIARAYLALLKQLNLRPAKIIQLIALKDVATKKPVGKWLPIKGLRKSYAATIQENKIHYWPKYISKHYPQLLNNIIDALHRQWQIEPSLFAAAQHISSLHEYSDQVESLLVTGLNDKQIIDYLMREPKGPILYTGGGIVPKALLKLPEHRFLHIHPGFLPDVRGADCTLWSTLLTNHPSASCFYMAPGIDTGDIIARYWLPSLYIQGVADNQSDLEQKMLYRSVFSFIDPWLRALVLKEVLLKHNQWYDIKAMPQTIDEGYTYHFMHERLVEDALLRFFTKKIVIK